MIELNEEQDSIKNNIINYLQLEYNKITRWSTLKSPLKVIGYAGTGKTFLLSMLRKAIDLAFPGIRVGLITFTGKASHVLENKLRENNVVFYGDFVGTIHSLIYRPLMKYDHNLKRKVIIGWTKKSKDEIMIDLILIDEASMVSNSILSDLKSYGLPIIAFGDIGQLPPIGDTTNILDNADYKLTQIQRQALKSPIIKLAHYVRKGGLIPVNKMYSNEVFKLSWNDSRCQKLFNDIEINDNSIFLCGFNATRVRLNNMARTKLGFKHNEPYPTERIMCLRNNHDSKLMNGQISTVMWYMPEIKNGYRLTILPDGFDEPYETLAHNCCFGQEKYPLYELIGSYSKEIKDFGREAKKRGFDTFDYFDYGYACSVHKSQGSEWDRVVLFEQRTHRWEDAYYAKWLYTAVTRAKKKLFIISDFY